MNTPFGRGLAALNVPAYVKHRGLIDWVARVVALAKPDRWSGAMARNRNTTVSASRWCSPAPCAA